MKAKWDVFLDEFWGIPFRKQFRNWYSVSRAWPSSTGFPAERRRWRSIPVKVRQ